MRGPLHPPLPAGAELLRRLRGRAVWLEGPRVVKAHWAPWFWSRGAFKGRRELRVLLGLAERGGAVPAVLGSERRSGWYCLILERIPGAQTLEVWLAEPQHTPAVRRRVLSGWARQVAALMALGLRQGDAHPGNWLIDGQGQAWAIDFERARLGRGLAWPRAAAELARLGALLDPLTSARERLRLLAAWRCALPAELVQRWPPAAQVKRQLARATELARRAEIERELDRWLRPSSRLATLAELTAWRTAAGPTGRSDSPAGVLHPSAAPTESRLVARAAPQHQRAALLAWAHGGPAPTSCWSLSGPSPWARQRWLTACRDWEHGLPVAMPLGLGRDQPSSWTLLFDLPEQAQARAPTPAEAEALDRRRQQRGLPQLEGAWTLLKSAATGLGPVTGTPPKEPSCCYLPWPLDERQP